MSAFKAGCIRAAKKSICVFLGVLALTLLFSQMVSAGSPLDLNASGPVTYVVTGSHVLVAAGLTLTGDNINSAQVSISANFTSGDYLGIQGVAGTSGVLSGIAWNYNAATGVMDLQNAVATATYQSVLRQVTYFNTSGNPVPTTRTIGFSIGSSLYYADTGHYYEYVNSLQTWDAAKTAAAGRSYFGLQGYLATVTSQAENDFILGKLLGWGWMGATDHGHESEWYWVTGPEGAANSGSGTYFFQQTGADGSSDHLASTYLGNNVPGGNTIGGLYNNWANNQPDDSGPSGEDYAHLYKGDYPWHPDGTWNDYSLPIQGYVVEYGGMSGDPVPQISGNVTVNLTYPRGVGGEVNQVNKLRVLIPGLVLVGGLMIGGTILVLNRRKRS